MIRLPFVHRDTYDDIFAKWCGSTIREGRLLSALAKSQAENAILRARINLRESQLMDIALAATLGPTGRVGIKNGHAKRTVEQQ